MGSQIKESIIFQYFAQLNSSQNFFTALVVFDGFHIVIMVRVHGACVEEEEMSKHSVVLFEGGFDGVNLSVFELIHIDKRILFLLVHQALEKAFFSDLSLSNLPSQ